MQCKQHQYRRRIQAIAAFHKSLELQSSNAATANPVPMVPRQRSNAASATPCDQNAAIGITAHFYPEVLPEPELLRVLLLVLLACLFPSEAQCLAGEAHDVLRVARRANRYGWMPISLPALASLASGSCRQPTALARLEVFGRRSPAPQRECRSQRKITKAIRLGAR